MTIGALVLVVLLILLIGGAVPWGPRAAPPGAQPAYWHGYGYGPVVPGGLGLLLLIVIILIVLDR